MVEERQGLAVKLIRLPQPTSLQHDMAHAGCFNSIEQFDEEPEAPGWTRQKATGAAAGVLLASQLEEAAQWHPQYDATDYK